MGREVRCSVSHILPGALFNATHIRLFLDRVLPSRACLRFTGHLMSAHVDVLIGCNYSAHIEKKLQK
jgi:hypothetical protein